jgi:hypothetical protein
LNSALYKADAYDKSEFKLIDALTAIGNDCAHNQPGATEERVKQLLGLLVALLPRLGQTKLLKRGNEGLTR